MTLAPFATSATNFARSIHTIRFAERGRAIIHGMLRRAEVAERVTVPLSAGLLTDTAGYFASLDAYRRGDVEAIVRSLTAATFHAAVGGRRLVDDLATSRAEYAERILARSDSVVWRFLDALVAQPVVDNAYVGGASRVSEIAAQRAIGKLAESRCARSFADGIRRVR